MCEKDDDGLGQVTAEELDAAKVDIIKKTGQPIMVGWVCPVCGAGCSPFTSQCNCTIKYEVKCDVGTFPNTI